MVPLTGFIAGLTALAAVTIAAATLTIDLSRIDPLTFAVLALGAGVAQRLPITLFRSSAVSVAFAATIATYVLYGTGAALLVNLVSAAVNAFTPDRKPLRKIAFNSAALTLSAFFAGSTYEILAGISGVQGSFVAIPAVVVSALVYFLLNTSLTASVIALSAGGIFLSRFAAVWRQNYAWMSLNFVATATAGGAMAIGYETLGTLGVAVFVGPVLAGWYSFRAAMANSREVRERNVELEDRIQVLNVSNQAFLAFAEAVRAAGYRPTHPRA